MQIYFGRFLLIFVLNDILINGVALEWDKSFDDLRLSFGGKIIVKENSLITVADGSFTCFRADII